MVSRLGARDAPTLADFHGSNAAAYKAVYVGKNSQNPAMIYAVKMVFNYHHSLVSTSRVNTRLGTEVEVSKILPAHRHLQPVCCSFVDSPDLTKLPGGSPTREAGLLAPRTIFVVTPVLDRDLLADIAAQSRHPPPLYSERVLQLYVFQLLLAVEQIQKVWVVHRQALQ